MYLYSGNYKIFKDNSLVARKNINSIDNKDLELLDSINEYNYVNTIDLIKNVNDLSIELIYDKRTKLYESITNYFDKTYKFIFINDDFIFRILNPLIE